MGRTHGRSLTPRRRAGCCWAASVVARQKKPTRVSAVKRAIVLDAVLGLACECSEGGVERRCCLVCD